MKNLRDALKSERLYFDGGFGTVVQKMGLPAGCPPESLNLTAPQTVTAIHADYLRAGSRIITTNTFGVNRDKYDNYKEIIAAAVQCAKDATAQTDAYIAFDVGPTGRMLQPLGDMEFEQAVALFAANIKEAVKHGVDLILIETMNDALETKAAVIAAKENSDLPIFVTNVYDKSGKLMTGANPKAMIAMLEGLGVDALGMNCSFGPDVMLQIIDDFITYSSVPIITSPNAGLPTVVNGETVYNVSPEEFAAYMEKLADKGVCILGGCCGTTPAYIRQTVERTRMKPYVYPTRKSQTWVSSYTHAVCIGNSPVLIGERINPTGKPKLKEALRQQDYTYILNEGIHQVENGAHILDVNVGLPEIDEVHTMYQCVRQLQAVTDAPLQLDSANPQVLEASMRIYNGKPLINSVNGKRESMDAVFPLVKKYGGAVIALTMDENGIPQTAKERFAIAKNIETYAARYGIPKKELVVDPLCMTVSSDQNSALVTLEAVRLLHADGFKTSLGVSNVSFGLPAREKLNAAFFNSALESGLNCAIINPFSERMTDTYYAFKALHGQDAAQREYIAYATAHTADASPATQRELSLFDAVLKGVKESARAAAVALMKTEDALAVVNRYIIPALNEVGEQFESGKMFLPQLLMSAEAAADAFDILKEKLTASTADAHKAVILATVQGDVHDIGKNIVKVLLESYGFKVHDLGKDVPPETVCEAVEQTGCKLVGLSALMTTTVPAMERTIALLHARCEDVTVVVGGAVLNQEYADMLHADAYCADAMETVRFTERYYQA